jgi:hypothetical protein
VRTYLYEFFCSNVYLCICGVYLCICVHRWMDA